MPDCTDALNRERREIAKWHDERKAAQEAAALQAKKDGLIDSAMMLWAEARSHEASAAAIRSRITPADEGVTPSDDASSAALRAQGEEASNVVPFYSEEALVQRDLDFLDRRADEWMTETSVRRMFDVISDVFKERTSPELLERFRQQMTAIGHQCFVEGGLRAWEEIAAQQRRIGRPLPKLGEMELNEPRGLSASEAPSSAAAVDTTPSPSLTQGGE